MLHQAAPKTSLRKKISLGVLVYVLAVLGLVLISVLLTSYQGDPSEDGDTTSSLLSANDQSRTKASGILVPPQAPTLGPSDAAVTIVEFGDFECPFCRQSAPVMRQLLERYPDDVRLVFRHMPLRTIHPLSESLAHASMCAHEQGRFWSFHDRLFQQQGAVTQENLASQAAAVGLDVNAFVSCQNSGKYEDLVQKDLAEAITRGGRGTPTWIVNGQLIQGALPLQLWIQAVESLLSQ